MRDAQRNFAGDDTVKIPGVYPELTSEKVMHVCMTGMAYVDLTSTFWREISAMCVCGSWNISVLLRLFILLKWVFCVYVAYARIQCASVYVSYIYIYIYIYIFVVLFACTHKYASALRTCVYWDA